MSEYANPTQNLLKALHRDTYLGRVFGASQGAARTVVSEADLRAAAPMFLSGQLLLNDDAQSPLRAWLASTTDDLGR